MACSFSYTALSDLNFWSVFIVIALYKQNTIPELWTLITIATGVQMSVIGLADGLVLIIPSPTNPTSLDSFPLVLHGQFSSLVEFNHDSKP